jgi:hypothetical protein
VPGSVCWCLGRIGAFQAHSTSKVNYHAGYDLQNCLLIASATSRKRSITLLLELPAANASKGGLVVFKSISWERHDSDQDRWARLSRNVRQRPLLRVIILWLSEPNVDTGALSSLT